MAVEPAIPVGVSRKIRILHLAESFSGGVFNSVQQLCALADPEMFETMVVHATQDITPPNFRELFPSDVYLEELPMMSREISVRQDTRSLLQLLRVLKRLRPDLLHLHSSKAGALGRVAARLLGIPCLYSPRGFSFLMMDRGCVKRRIYYALEKLLARVGGIIVACSETEFNYASGLGKSQLVNNGVDTEFLDSVHARFVGRKTDDRLVIGTSGRICFQKNPSFFLQLAKEFPEARWVWIGDGVLRPELNEKKSGIVVTGWKDRAETLEIVAGFDIFLQTSLWEGMPISVLEAMGMAKPVVATHVIGNQDVVLDGTTGFLADDLDGLAKALRKLGPGQEALRRAMGEAGRRRVKENFDAKAKAAEWMELYERIASRSA
jgi:glycosyltransferase involved in cell wall biosynthesis